MQQTIHRPVRLDGARSWWVAGIGLLMAALSFGAVTSIPILLKPLMHDWNVGATAVSTIHTSAMIGAAIGSLLLGRLLERVSFFHMAVVAATCSGVGLVLAASAEHLATLHWIYGFLIGGIGQGVFFSPLTGAVSQWFDEHRSTAIAIVASGQSVGGLLLPTLLRWSVESFGWRLTLTYYGVAAGLALGACAFAFQRAPPAPVRHGTDARSTSTQPSTSARTFLALGCCIALSNHASFVVIAHLTAFGEDLGLGPTQAAGLVSTMLGATLISRLCVGQIAKRWGRYNVLLAMSTLLAIGTCSLAVSTGVAAIVVCAFCIGVAFGGFLPGYAILVRELFPAAQASRRIAEIYSFAFLAAGIGSWTGALLRDLSGAYTLSFGIAGVGALLSVGMLTRLSPGTRSV